MASTIEKIKQLREETAAGMMDVKRALEASDGDLEGARRVLRERGQAIAAKKSARETHEGLIEAYIHFNGRVGVLLEVNCETDFVARTDDFKNTVRAIAEHIAGSPTAPLGIDKDAIPAENVEKERRIFEEQTRAAGKPEAMIEKIVAGKIESYYKDVALLHQPWIREPKKTIGDLVKETSARVGEHIQVRRFVRYQLGEE